MPSKNFDNSVDDFANALLLLIRRIRAASPASDLSASEIAVVTRLDTLGMATTADLARAENMKPQSMGTIISKLKQMSLVKRKPHPTDGRQVNIELTAKGTNLRRSTREAKRTWLAHAIAGMSKEEQTLLFAAGEVIQRLAEQ